MDPKSHSPVNSIPPIATSRDMRMRSAIAAAARPLARPISPPDLLHLGLREVDVGTHEAQEGDP